MKEHGYSQLIELGINTRPSENAPFTRLVDQMCPQPEQLAEESGDKRRYSRHSTAIPCVAHIARKGNQVIVLTGTIRNISTSGMLLELRDKGHLYAAMFREIESFQVSLILEGDIVACVDCLPRHIEDAEELMIGVQVNDEDAHPLLPMPRRIM
ncbi:PilZ domain-containing protein [Desulfovibrio psychrotolerans]|uniref:PilZ domain-containing protein n=1 Tax=Desulfovibrio psychrotolerans TaxID=415242 RepID=A0A7J0BU99_9BACT|nr:PilZ domain-containing protein [Desulfovibrio psychrotolerans]GFM37290.1 hypothetical protein DSM19430T_19740 [Desulfovibrio psychrotolerans]